MSARFGFGLKVSHLFSLLSGPSLHPFLGNDDFCVRFHVHCLFGLITHIFVALLGVVLVEDELVDDVDVGDRPLAVS